MMSTYLAEAVADSEMVELADDKVRGPFEPVADKVRGPVDVEIVLLVEPASVNVADVVGPEAPMVADVEAPVPRTTAPDAERAPFTVVGAVRVRLEASTVKEYVAADKARGPVDVEIVLLRDPASVNVADVVVPEAPIVVNAVAPVPRMTAPAAVRAPPSDVAPVPTVSAPLSVVAPDAPSVPATETPAEVSASRLGALAMPMLVPEVPIRTPLMSM